MPTTCCIKGCFNNTSKDKQRGIKRSYYAIPKVKANQGQIVQRVTAARRREWLKAIYRRDLSFYTNTAHFQVCSDHFISGRPAYEMAETDPDWAPSLKLGHQYAKKPSSRALRMLERKKKARAAQNKQNDGETMDANMETEEFASREHFVGCDGPTEEFSHTWRADYVWTNVKQGRPPETKRKTTCTDTGGQSDTGHQPDFHQISSETNQASAAAQLSASTMLLAIAQLSATGQLSTKSESSMNTLPSLITQSLAITQPSIPDHDYAIGTGKPKAKLEDLVAGEKATQCSLNRLAEQLGSQVSTQTHLQTDGPHFKSADQKPEELQLLNASKSLCPTSSGSLDSQPSVAACGPVPVMLIGPQERKLLSRICPAETRSSGDGVCRAFVLQKLREKLAVPPVVVKEEPIEDIGDDHCVSEEVVVNTGQESAAALPVEVKMESVEDSQCFDERDMCQTPQDFAVLPLEVKMESVEDSQCCDERDMCQTPQDFAVLPLEVKIEPDMGDLDNLVQVKTEPPDSWIPSWSEQKKEFE